MNSLISEEFPLHATQSVRYNLDWSYRNPDPALATSVPRIRTWYSALDTEFETVVRGF